MPFIENDFVELKDCVFIKGLPTNANIEVSHVRQYFKERIGECCVEMSSLSKDKRWFFVALKFKSPSVAEKVMERFGGKYVFGHRVTMSHWRVPRSKVPSGKLQQESHQPNNSTWEYRENIDGNVDTDRRHNEESLGERRSWDTNRASGDLVGDKQRDDFRDDSGNIRHFQDNEGQYKIRDNYIYQEQTEGYYPQQWDNEQMEEVDYYEDNWNGWDSAHNGTGENFCEREKYDREEELPSVPYHHDEDIWQGRELNQDDSQAFFDQNQSWDYDRRYNEPDRNQEYYCEGYEGNFSQEYDNSQYDDYRRRPEEASHDNEDLRESIREWRGQRENSKTQELQAQRQEDISNNFSRFYEEDHSSRWAEVSPTNPTRRRLSDPDVPQREWEQDFADQRSCNNSRDFTSRKRENFVEERPRSDEWLESGWRRVEKRGRRSVSPVSLRSRDYDHQEIPLSEERGRKRSQEALDIRAPVNLTHSADFASSVRDHPTSSSSPRKRNSPGRSTRDSSSEASPLSERSSYSCSEQFSERRFGGSRSFDTRERHHNSRVPNERGRPERSKKEADLRRSLMEYQHRKHISCTGRDRSKEEKLSYSSSERERKSSPGENYRSTGSRSTAESTSSSRTGNRKRRREDERTRHDMESNKKRKETSHSSTGHSDTASKSSELREGQPQSKPSGEKKTHSSRDHLSRTGKPRGKVTDKSSTKRTDRLLNDLAVTLAGDNISLRRPSPDIEDKHRNYDRKRQPADNKNSPYKRSYEKYLDQISEMDHIVRDQDVQLVDSSSGGSNGKDTVVGWYTTEESSEGETTASENGTICLKGPYVGGDSNQDVDSVAEAYDSVEGSFPEGKSSLTFGFNYQPLKISPGHPTIIDNNGQQAKEAKRFFGGDNAKLDDNSHNATGATFANTTIQPFRPSPKLSEFTNIETNSSYVVDKLEKTPETVDEETNVVEKRSNKDSEQLNLCLKHPDFQEIQTNDTFIFDDFKKTQKVKANEDVLPLKTSGIRLVRQEDGNLRVENCHVVDMEFSSDDQISPDVKSGNEFCFTVDSRNFEKNFINYSREDKCISKRACLIVPRSKKILNSGGITSGVIVSRHQNEPSISCKEVKNVSRGTLKQEACDVESKAADSSRHDAAGLCSLFTQPSIYSNKLHQDREKALTQRSYNIKDLNYVGGRKREKTTLDDHQVNSIYTEEQLSNFSSSKVADQSQQIKQPVRDDKLVTETTNTERMGPKKDDLGNKERVTVGVSKELTQVSDPNSKKKVILKSDFEVHDKITREKNCDDRNDCHDYKAIIEECNVEHEREDNNGQEQETTPDEGIDDAVKRIGLSDISQEVKSRQEINCSTGWRNCKRTEAEATYKDEERFNEGRFDVMSNGNRTSEVYNMRTKEGKDSVSAVMISEEEVCEGKSSVATCYDNNGIQKRSKQKDVDFDRQFGGQKGDNRVVEMTAMDDFGVKHKKIQIEDVNLSDVVEKMYSCQDLTARSNGDVKNEDHVTNQQPIHFLDNINLSVNTWNKEDSCPTVHRNGLSGQGNLRKQKCYRVTGISKADVVSKVSGLSQTTVEDCRSFDASVPERGDCSNVSLADPGIIDRSCFNWSQIESHQSHLDDADKTISSSSNTCSVSHDLKESKLSVKGDLEHVDMEISSDEEHRPKLIDNIACVVDEVSGAKPYSPSSPTVKSDDQCSPQPKDSSPYSPSHPTNVSEGDLDKNDLVKELSYHEEVSAHGVSTSGDKEIIGCPLENSFPGNNAGDYERTITAQEVRNNSSDVCSESLVTVCSEKSKSGSLPSIPTVEDALDVNLPVGDVAPSGDRKIHFENESGDEKGIAASRCNSSPNTINENSQKSLLSCPQRTQSLPNISTVVSKPKIVYISATRSKGINAHETVPSKNDNSVDEAIKSGDVNCVKIPIATTVEINPQDSSPESKRQFASNVSLELHERSLCIFSSSQGTSQATEVTFKDSLSMNKTGEGVEFNPNCDSVVTPVTSEQIEKRPITSASQDDLDKQDGFQSHERARKMVREGEICNRKDEFDEESVVRASGQGVLSVLTPQPHCASPSRPDHKRSHEDVRDGPRPCKVPKKSLKLIIPSHQVSDGNATGTPPQSESKDGSCAVTDLRFVSDRNGSKADPLKEPLNVTGYVMATRPPTTVKANSKTGFVSNKITKTRAKMLKKTTSHTVTRADLDSVLQQNSLPSSEIDNDASEDIVTVHSSENREILTPLEPLSSKNTVGEGNSISGSDSFKGTNNHSSSSSTKDSSHYQHNKHLLNSGESIRTDKRREKGTGLEPDQIASRMERLRKKKEEIEQVYKRECQTVINVVKMLVSNDPRLEGILQNAVRRSLQEMGERCVQELEKEVRPAT